MNNTPVMNNTPIRVAGLITTEIKLEKSPDFSAKINFHILEEDSFTIIIGLDFLNQHLITVHYNPSKDELNKRIKLFQEIASTEIIDIPVVNSKTAPAEFETDFDAATEKRLKNVIEEVENLPVSPITEEYVVKVALKDDSTYAYMPRRFAWSERIQREIYDLLAREIIKESTSPYCARVVPVRKKNDTLRLCVDLRPLNDRVIKQKFPFPLIENCLARLSNRTVFTLLDLKDSFYQIKLHPDHFKYFSFATPDGQYEYTRLPFGFCEAPAEFQKRIVQILQPLIKDDKVYRIYR